jgi:N-acetylneuraminic acid mutarotase
MTPNTAPSGPSGGLQVKRASWQLPLPRAREVVLAGAHALYVVGGLDAGKSSTARVWHVALPGGTTTRVATLPQIAHDASGAILANDVFVFGGGEAQTIATVQRVHDGTAAIAGQLPDARSDSVAVTIGATAYVLGGFDGTRGLSDVLATTDGVHFRTVAQLAQAVRYPAAAVVDGRIWLFGGEHNGNNVTTVQVIDPMRGTATIAAQLPQALAHESALVVDGQVLLAGGRHAGRILDTIERFDPAAGRITAQTTMPYPVADAGAATVDGVGYIVGGETPRSLPR